MSSTAVTRGIKVVVTTVYDERQGDGHQGIRLMVLMTVMTQQRQGTYLHIES